MTNRQKQQEMLIWGRRSIVDLPIQQEVETSIPNSAIGQYEHGELSSAAEQR